jgi:hypothetical protein
MRKQLQSSTMPHDRLENDERMARFDVVMKALAAHTEELHKDRRGCAG